MSSALSFCNLVYDELYFLPIDVITFEEYAGQAEGALTNNHSPSLNSVKHPSGID